MSRLDELIQELCPNGVECKKMSEVTSITRGVRVIRSQLLEYGKYPVYQNSMTPLGYYDKSNCQANTPFIISAGAAGEIGFSTTDFWAADDCFYFLCPPSLNSRFLYHVLLNQKASIAGKVRKASIPRLPRVAVDNLLIPIPPLQVQSEIVRILDYFTELTAELIAELTVELTARKKQYEYYREYLLTHSEDTPKVALKTVVKKSCSGGTPKKGISAYYENGTVPWLRTQDIKFNEIQKINSYITEVAVKKTSAKWIPANCVIVAISGATAGRCAINKIATTTNQHCLNMEIDNSKAIYKYIFYCICNQYEELLSRKQGARGDLNSTLILGIEIPLPSLEEQQRIVDILDRFDALCNDISIDTPAEIAARQMQYEYYRDKLLTFKELS